MKRWHWIALALLTAVAVVAQGVMPHHEGGHWWDLIPGSYAAYGFVGCAAIIFVSKWIGKLWVQRPEGYYDGP